MEGKKNYSDDVEAIVLAIEVYDLADQNEIVRKIIRRLMTNREERVKALEQSREEVKQSIEVLKNVV